MKKYLLLTEAIDGITEPSMFYLEEITVIVHRVNISDFEKESFIKDNILKLHPGIIFIATTYGDFISPIADMLGKICSHSLIILFGTLINDCIFPPLKWNTEISSNIDYVTISDTCLGIREYLSYFVNKSLPKQIKTVFLRIAINKSSANSSGDIIPELAHLPFQHSEAVRELKLNQFINQKIKDKFFKDKFVLVAALPKSASSVIGSCISIIHSKGKDTRNYGRYMQENQDSDLRPEIIKDFPYGGLVKYHTSSTGKNLKVLNILGVRYVIVLREPIDQITAIYCHYLNTLNSEAKLLHPGNLLYDHIYPIFKEKFVSEFKFMKYLIKDGYLFKVLSWIVDW